MSISDLEKRIKGAQSEAAKRRVSEGLDRRTKDGESDKKAWSSPAGDGEKKGEVTNQKTPNGQFSPDDFLGTWVDSLGHTVVVSSEDAFQLKLLAVLSKPDRRDKLLSMRPLPGGGWVCGNATLDPTWSEMTRLHWLTEDKRVSVWVRLQPDGTPCTEEKPKQQQQEEAKEEAKEETKEEKKDAKKEEKQDEPSDV
mmetsp:Transcript_39330/g.83788  ORF Transcript_39330/g.83788 Transcript_39330/m.83788 type:complete len:196 (-) Transcript_39330:106-693(-)